MMQWAEPGSAPPSGAESFVLQCASDVIEMWLSGNETPSEETRTCKLCRKTWQDAIAHETCLGCFLLGAPKS